MSPFGQPHSWWLVWSTFGAGCAVAAPARVTADFSVTVQVQPPAGCVATVSAGTNGTPVATLTCGSNLFVNVQPVLATTQLPAATSSGALSPTPFTSEARPPADAPRNLAALLDPADTRGAVVAGGIFVQRRGGGAGAELSAGLVPPPDAGPDGVNTRPGGQPVEMWLI